MTGLVFTVLVAGPGVLAWLVGVTTLAQRVRLVRTGLRGMGTVVDLAIGSCTPSRDGGVTFGTRPARFSVVEVRDATTGTPIRFQTTIGTSRTQVVVGSQVPVRYMPGTPDQAEIDRPFSLWGLPILMCAAGTVFLALWWYVLSAVAAAD